MLIPREEKKNSKSTISIVAFVILLILFIYLLIPKENLEENIKGEKNKTSKENITLVKENICLGQTISNSKVEKIKKFETEKTIEFKTTYNPEECHITIERNVNEISEYDRLWTEIYIVVTRFDNHLENISREKLEEKILKGKNIIWGFETDEFLKTKFKMGVGYPKYSNEDIYEKIKEDKNTIAIVPLEQANKLYKIIPVDNRAPTSKEFNELIYPLSDSYYISKENTPTKEKISQYLLENIGENKYEKEKLVKIILTGKSAIGSRTQYINLQENEYTVNPLENLKNILNEGDINHISNTSPFWTHCTQTKEINKLCGLPESLEILKSGNINLVGVTGNHIVDYGGDAFRQTLQLYEENEITYFGAGNTEVEAHTVKIVEKDGLRFAFLGYNLQPPQIYWALGQRGGTASISPEKLRRDIQQAKENADYIFIEMQWGETNQHEPNKQQIEYGKIAIEEGANIITGIYPNWVQGIEYINDGIIFYGLGNFLFEDLEGKKSKESILIEHMFYKNKYIGYNIIPLQISENMEINIADIDTRKKILNTVFKHSKINLNNNKQDDEENNEIL